MYSKLLALGRCRAGKMQRVGVLIRGQFLIDRGRGNQLSDDDEVWFAADCQRCAACCQRIDLWSAVLLAGCTALGF